jgi:hypothetical protein
MTRGSACFNSHEKRLWISQHPVARPQFVRWQWTATLAELIQDLILPDPSAWVFTQTPVETVDARITPTMTSNTTPAGYTVTSDSSSPDAYKPLNDTNWIMGTLVNTSSIWWALQVPMPRILTRCGLLVSVTGGVSQIILSLEGSNDGSSWTLIDNPAVSQGTFQGITLDADGAAYKYFRIAFGQTYTQTTTITLHSIAPLWTTLFEGI